MYVLQIEYPIADYDSWNAAFDDDRRDRADLEFDDAG